MNKRDQWRQLISEWERSGQTRAEFAKARGLVASTFAWWKTTLRREARALAEGKTAAPLKLARVSSEALISTPKSRSLVVRVGAASIEVSDGFDAALLASVVAALGAKT
jgi:hypothetical protein